VRTAQHVFFFHFLLSLVISMLTSFILISSFTQSIHLFLGRPLLGVLIYIHTHHSFRYVTFIPLHNIPVPSQPIASHFFSHWRYFQTSPIYLFLILSIVVTLLIHLNILYLVRVHIQTQYHKSANDTHAFHALVAFYDT
jgi:hypothetical protein